MKRSHAMEHSSLRYRQQFTTVTVVTCAFGITAAHWALVGFRRLQRVWWRA